MRGQRLYHDLCHVEYLDSLFVLGSLDSRGSSFLARPSGRALRIVLQMCWRSLVLLTRPCWRSSVPPAHPYSNASVDRAATPNRCSR
jgi:hypothetical protein